MTYHVDRNQSHDINDAIDLDFQRGPNKKKRNIHDIAFDSVKMFKG